MNLKYECSRCGYQMLGSFSICPGCGVRLSPAPGLWKTVDESTALSVIPDVRCSPSGRVDLSSMKLMYYCPKCRHAEYEIHRRCVKCGQALKPPPSPLANPVSDKPKELLQSGQPLIKSSFKKKWWQFWRK